MRAKIGTLLYWLSIAWFVAAYLFAAWGARNWMLSNSRDFCIPISPTILLLLQYPATVLVAIALILDFRSHRLIVVLAMIAFGVVAWIGCGATADLLLKLKS